MSDPSQAAAQPSLLAGLATSLKVPTSTGVVVAGTGGLIGAVTEAITDIGAALHVPIGHPGAWAALIVAGFGYVLHTKKG